MNDQIAENLLKAYLELNRRVILLERKLNNYDKNMEKEIRELEKEHTQGDYSKYLLECGISDFKKFQRTIRNEFKIKDGWGKKGLWKHDADIKLTYGTVKFNNFEINVMRYSDYTKDFVLRKVDKVDNIFWNSKKE